MRLTKTKRVVMGMVLVLATSLTVAEVLFVTAAAPVVVSKDCTDGVDCYCDLISDPSLLMCEDFEVPSMHPDDATEAASYDGNGSPGYGSWHDAGVYRGSNSYWAQTYGVSGPNCNWPDLTPANPVLGVPCNVGGLTCNVKAWHPDDIFDGNDNACIVVVQDGEFAEEIATNVAPTGARDGGSGVFDGKASFGHRVQPGNEGDRIGSTSGLPTWSAAVYEVGVTQALAYGSNTGTSGVLDDQWKHNQYRCTGNTCLDGTGIYFNLLQQTTTDHLPFAGFTTWYAGQTNADCLTAHTVRRGNILCASSGFYWWYVDLADYNRSQDFPYGTWACIRSHITGLDGPVTTHRLWFNDTLVIDYDVNTSLLAAQDGYIYMTWNGYSNANIGAGTSDASAFRYEDNVHIREGAPVSCESIGF